MYKHNITVQGLILQDVYSNNMMCTIIIITYNYDTYNIVITIYHNLGVQARKYDLVNNSRLGQEFDDEPTQLDRVGYRGVFLRLQTENTGLGYA